MTDNVIVALSMLVVLGLAAFGLLMLHKHGVAGTLRHAAAVLLAHAAGWEAYKDTQKHQLKGWRVTLNL